MPRTISELSIDTRLIMERLDACNIGDVVSYDELSQIIGREITSCYYLTTTARKRLLAANKYFEAVPGVGFRRCNDSQKVAGGGAYLQRSRRACKRGATITASVDDYDAMSKGDQRQHNAQLSLLLTMRAMSTPSKVKAIEAKVEDSHQRLSMKSTLEAIAGSKRTRKTNKTNGTTQKLPVDVA